MKYSELIERKRHGTPDFPIEYYYTDKTHPRYVMQAHWHKEFEVIRVKSGSLTLFLNNVRYELLAGDCVFVEGGCLKCGYPDECVYECLVFDTAMLKRQRMTDSEKNLFDNPASSFSFKNLIDRSDNKIIKVIDDIFSAMSECREVYEVCVVSLLYSLFFELYTSGYITKKHAAPPDKTLTSVMMLLEWIENNLSEQITLSGLSSASGLSENYICRIFKLYTSKTVMEYVNERRIEKACLEIADKSITEVAFACGFNDLSYFCKLFKRYKGISPRAYREERQGGVS